MAIADIDRPLEEEAPALAAILGASPYDVRLALHGTPPSIVLRTPSRDLAERALAGLRARRCSALLIDLDDVVPTGRMVAVRRFALDDDGLHASESGPKLLYEDLAALVRVAASTNVERTTVELEVRGTGRGGAVTVEEERTRREREHEQLLYLFPRDGVPWVLRAREARYLGLGAGLRATVHENFLATIAVLRARAPRAAYDERFVAHPLTRHHAVQVRGDVRSKEAISDAGLDLPVHLVARWIVASSGGPYRDARE
ncbi:MAG: hypothetical protein ABI175_03800 [Polyangiales bacterium]